MINNNNQIDIINTINTIDTSDVIDKKFVAKYIKYKIRNTILESQIGGIIEQQCEKNNSDKNKISLFNLEEISLSIFRKSTDAEKKNHNIFDNYKLYTDYIRQYGDAHKFTKMRRNNRDSIIGKKKSDFFNTLSEELSPVTKHKMANDMEQKEITKYNKETSDILKILNYNFKNISGKEHTSFPYLINNFLDNKPEKTLDIVDLYDNIKDTINTFTTGGSNILFDVIGSYLNLNCDKTKLSHIIDSIRNDKKMYIIDFMNVCSAINNVKKRHENAINLIFSFLNNVIVNDNLVIIVFKSGCMEKNDVINNIALNDTLFDKLNKNIFIISLEGKGNADDFIFWIFATYFYNLFKLNNKKSNLILMTEDKQKLLNGDSNHVYTNIKNLLYFEKGYLNGFETNPHNIKYFYGKVTNKNNIIETIDNKTLIYFNIFDKLMSIRDVDLLTTYQLHNKILDDKINLINMFKVVEAETQTINFDFVKKLVSNFVPPGIVFYAYVKFIQYSMYSHHDGSLSRDIIYDIITSID